MQELIFQEEQILQDQPHHIHYILDQILRPLYLLGFVKEPPEYLLLELNEPLIRRLQERVHDHNEHLLMMTVLEAEFQDRRTPCEELNHPCLEFLLVVIEDLVEVPQRGFILQILEELKQHICLIPLL